MLRRVDGAMNGKRMRSLDRFANEHALVTVKNEIAIQAYLYYTHSAIGCSRV